MLQAEALLDSLNPAQKEAVGAGKGPLMVLAGAGSGKTRVLTHRLAYLLVSGMARPDQILAVTFTNKAAREMRERVERTLPEINLHAMWIGTFHGMGARMLRQHSHLLGYQAPFSILDTSDQERLLKRIMEEAGFSHVYWTPGKLAAGLSRWKDDAITPDQLHADMFRTSREFAGIVDLFQRYQKELLRLNAMDFSDLLLNCLLLWQQQPEILQRFQEAFHFVLVDEYQDTNAVQYRWLRALAAKHGNLCVVGDDDQVIYSWRGARIDNMLNFQEDFPQARVVRLEQNYRSTSRILKVAGQLITHNSGRMGKTLWTEGQEGAKITLYAAEDSNGEARYIAREIGQAMRKEGRSHRDFAILVRTSRQTRALEEAFNKEMVPYQIVGGMRFMDRAEIRDAVAYLRLLVTSRDDLAFERIVNVPRRGVGNVALLKLREWANEHQCSLLEAAATPDCLAAIKGPARKGLEELVAVLENGRAALDSQMPPNQVLDMVLMQSGYLKYLEGEEKKQERFENLNELANELARRENIVEFLEEAALVADMHQDDRSGIDRVVISTLHAAKGLEFPVVFLAGLEEGLLPHQRSIDEGNLEEERRLAYVGMTRARERLVLTHARWRQLGTGSMPTNPSRFLREIPREEIADQSLVNTQVFRGVRPGVPAFLPKNPWNRR
ncbi:MAG: UvrD-helicase domain-containing protein [Magnetococcales bacterium]|nr:UvrD-helicase domain-containing protein [Magnetococcales bacterium]